jgi:hypothetical protein
MLHRIARPTFTCLAVLAAALSFSLVVAGGAPRAFFYALGVASAVAILIGIRAGERASRTAKRGLGLGGRGSRAAVGWSGRGWLSLLLGCVAVPCVLSVASVSSGAAGVSTVPSSVPHAATCSPKMADATVALQAWFDSIPNGTLARLDGSCYRVDGRLVLGAKTDVTLDGAGSKFQTYAAGNQDSQHLLVGGDVGTTIENLSIDGGKTVPGYDARFAFQHGITITGGCDRVVLDNVTIDHVWGDYVAITPHSRNRDHVRVVPRNITIKNSHFGLDRIYMGSGRQGISIQEGEHIFVYDNVIRYSSRSAVDIEPDSSGATLDDIHFVHNTFGPHGLNLFANHNYGNANPVIDGIYIRDNTLTGTPLQIDSVADITNINSHDPATFRRHHYEIVNNVSDTGLGNGSCADPSHEVIRLWGIDGVVIDHNVQPVQAGRCMMLATFARDANTAVTNNTIKNASAPARYYQSFKDQELGNQIGNPLYLAPVTAPATMT